MKKGFATKNFLGLKKCFFFVFINNFLFAYIQKYKYYVNNNSSKGKH